MEFGWWDCYCWSSLDAGPVAPLTANDFVALFQGAFSFAVLALPFHLSGFLLHVVSSRRRMLAAGVVVAGLRQQLKERDGECGCAGTMSDQNASEVFIEAKLEVLEIGLRGEGGAGHAASSGIEVQRPRKHLARR